METKVNYAVVGAFVLVLGAALVGSVLMLSSERSFRKSYDGYRVLMEESVSGLSPDAPVRYRGVQVGRVRHIALAIGDIEKVELALDIERGTPIRQDTVAVLRTQGLTGIAHVELTGGSRESPALIATPGEGAPVIRAGPSFMVRLDATVTGLIGSLTRSSEGLNALLDEPNRLALGRTLANLARVSGTLAARAADIEKGLAGASGTLDGTARAAALLPALIERVQRSADAFDRLAGEAGRAAAGARAAAERAGNDFHAATEETVPELRLAIDDVRDLASSLRRLTDELERNPAMLVHGRAAGKPGPGE